MAKDFLASVIADAKQVKETAMANAKMALEETFQPSLQRMISSRIAEEDGEEEMDDVDIDINYGGDDEGGEDAATGFGSFEDEETGVEPAAEEEVGEDLELEALIRELDGEYEDEEMMGEGEEGMDDTDLEEGLDFLDEEEGYDDEEMMGEGEEVMDDMDLEEALDALLREEGLGDMLDNGPNKEDGSVYDETPPSGNQFLENRKLRNENKKLKKDLSEAYRVVTTLKKTMNDVNLLNARLMYTTKTLSNFNLNEAQQHRVLDSFDRANTVREVKLVYTTIVESFNKKPLKRVTEGSASRSIKAIKPSKQQLNENSNIINNDLVKKMQRLAGITKETF